MSRKHWEQFNNARMSRRQEDREENRGRYTFENPTITRYKVKPNPGFYCRDYIETHNHVNSPVLSCSEQCDECVNAIAEYHKEKEKARVEWDWGLPQVCLSPDCDCESLCPGQCLCLRGVLIGLSTVIILQQNRHEIRH
jgi:hypothetical protein